MNNAVTITADRQLVTQQVCRSDNQICCCILKGVHDPLLVILQSSTAVMGLTPLARIVYLRMVPPRPNPGAHAR